MPEPAALRARHQRARDHVAHADRLAHRVGPARVGPAPDRRAPRPLPPGPRRHDGAGHAAAHRHVLQRPGRGAGQLPAAVRLRRQRAASGPTTTAATSRPTVPLRRPRARPRPAACASASSGRAPTGARRSSRARSAWLALSWGGDHADLRGRGDGAARGHREVLARLAGAGDDRTTTRGGRTSSAARSR